MFTALLLATLAVAGAPTPAGLHAGLAGHWKGSLGYRDYQSDRLFELPVTSEFRMVPDGVSEVTVSAFDDGPKAGKVYITSLSLFDVNAGTLISTSFRRGQKPDLETQNVAVTEYRDPTHWTLTYEATATDGDQPARLRITETREGDALLSVKEAAPLSPPNAALRFRNQTRLVKVR